MTAPDPGKPIIQSCDICEIRWHADSLTDGTCPRCIAEDAICTEESL